MEITIRHIEPEDFEAMHEIFSGPKAVSGTMQTPFPSRETWRERLANPPDGLFSLVACADGDEIVGNIALITNPSRWRMRHAAGIGMAVRDDWQGKGVGSKLMEAALGLADNWLGLTRVELQVHTDNEAGIALYKKFGFEVEGAHRRHALRDGEYVDAYSMARIKPPPE